MKNSVKISHYLLLSLILVLALAVRVYKIEDIPAGMYYDELDLGYQARSFVQTFKDYKGNFSPFYFSSQVDLRTPIPIYFAAITTLIFKTPELQLRMSTVLLGVLNVLMVFLLVKQFRKDLLTPFLAALVFATNPWQIQYSRIAYEQPSVLFSFLVGLYFFSIALKGKKFINYAIATALLSYSVYSYRIMSLLVPITFLGLFLIYKKEFLSFGLKKILLLAGIFLLIVVPFLYFTTVGAKDKPRIAMISVFSDEETPIWVLRNREIDSGDFQNPEIGKAASKLSYLFHNKPLSYFYNFATNYFSVFSTSFLFLEGDPIKRHSIPNHGVLFYIDIIPLFFGLFYLFRNLKIRENRLIIFLFFVTPIAACLTQDGGNHASRLIPFSLPLLLSVSFGWSEIYNTFKKNQYSKFIFSFLILVWLILFVFYLHRYFVHYSIESGKYYDYGFKQAVQRIVKEEKNYKNIVLVPTYGPPALQFLFWSGTPPKQVQDYGLDFSEGKYRGKELDKLKVINLPQGNASRNQLIDLLKTDTIYLVTPKELDIKPEEKDKPIKGIKFIQIINYPDWQPAFYLITKEPNS